ncbi:hypothetical protein ACIQYL_21010 [Lysinibacillus xylanilyticus]|uniref:hypothetical protein n=1 Tax=Lysinibacillus xylanilyticus TaxID=582475 RepID=UPI003829A2AA
MKIVTLIGTKDKTDFAFYLAHAVRAMKKNVLIVDATKAGNYLNGYFQTVDSYLPASDEVIHSLNNIDVLCEAANWVDVGEILRINNITTTNYDCIFIDLDSIESLLKEWPDSDMTLYVSDSERSNLAGDVPLLHRYFDEKETNTIRRIHFDSAYSIPADYIETIMQNRPSFDENSIEFDYDDEEIRLRMMMQHEHVIPYNKLNKAYKRVLHELSCELFQDMPIRDIANQTKKPFLANLRRKKSENNASHQQTIGG